MSPPLDPRHGVHNPGAGTLARAVGSVRRTSNIDALRPGGLDGDLVLIGSARDLLTDSSGESEVLGSASMRARVAFEAGRRVEALEVSPGGRGVETLVGTSASAGFRGRVDAAVPDERERRSLSYLLLDDVPVATLISGFALGHAGRRPLRVGPAAKQPAKPDLCSGWMVGGTIMVEIGRSGRSPQVTGPPAPPLELVDDPLAWHRMDRLPPHGVRRRRRLDVVAGSTLVVDAMFRDSHMGADGLETVVHEYAFKGVMDSRTFEVLEAEAVDHVLPWTECSLAASSATRLIGKYAGMLRTEVRTELVGPSTCTHLNDLLRSVEDVVALAPLLSADAEG